MRVVIRGSSFVCLNSINDSRLFSVIANSVDNAGIVIGVGWLPRSVVGLRRPVGPLSVRTGTLACVVLCPLEPVPDEARHSIVGLLL